MLWPTWCTMAAAPLAIARRIFTKRVTWYAVEVFDTSTSVRFHSPVTTNTANAGQATRENAWATTFVASGAALRKLGTTPASAIWPPTHTEAERMWTNSRSVFMVGESIGTSFDGDVIRERRARRWRAASDRPWWGG